MCVPTPYQLRLLAKMRKKCQAFLSPASVVEDGRDGMAATPPSKPLLVQSTTEVPTDATKTQARTATKPWTPFVLRRWVLIAFSITLLAIIASLEVVWKVCDTKHGFGPVDSKLHYVWTYGPTAVFTLAAAFWTQVDYRTRLMQPWEELAKEARPAQRNLLLDHVSRHPVLSFCSALKFRHWPVVVVLFASLALKAIIVISTGLFALQLVNEPISTPLSLTAQFQGRNFDASSVDYTAVSLYKSALLDRSDYPVGTNADFAVETFNLSGTIPATSYNISGTVKSFTAGLDCEPAILSDNITLHCEDYYCTSENVFMTAATSDCRISNFQADNINTGTYHDGWFGHTVLARCDNDDKGEENQRIIITAAYIDGDLYMTGDSDPNLKNSTTLFCKPFFSIQNSSVTVDETGSIIQADHGEPLEDFDEINGTSIADGVLKTMSADGSRDGAYGYNTSDFRLGALLKLALVSQGAGTIEDLSNFDLLAKGAHQVYRGVAVQLAKQYLLGGNVTESDQHLEGVAHYNHQRLFVRSIFLRIVETILGILVFLSTFLALRPRRQVPLQDVASIARFSAAVSKSTNLMDALSGTGSWPCQNLKHLLQGTYNVRYKPTAEDVLAEHLAFVIEGHQSAAEGVSDSKKGFWRPLMISWYVRVALLVMPLAIIIALETLLRVSHRDSGLCDILQNRQTQLGAAIVPAFVMALTKLLYSGYDFNVRIFDPYVQLHNRSAPAKPSVLNKTIYTWKTDAFWSAFLDKRYAVGASTLSVTVAAFLTIAASGLFSPTPVSRDTSVEVTQLDQFSFPASENVYTPISEPMVRKTRLVAYEETGNSNWTYGQYALPQIALPSSYSNFDNMTSVDLEVPVYRGSLNCTLVPSEQTTINYTDSNAVNVWWSDLIGCTSITVPTPDGYQEIQPVYNLTDGLFARWAPYSFGNIDRDGCPQSWGIYGTWSNQSATELNIVQCWSSLHEVQASVRLSIPGQRIISLSTEESTKKNIVTGPYSYPMLEEVFPGSMNDAINGPFKFFLKNEKPGSFSLDLLQRENFFKLKECIQKGFGLAAAELLNMRRNTTKANVNPVIKATATYSVIRLMQNDISTRILQALLASMVICAIISLFTVRLSEILPKNPCSIAAQASLIAGSEMVSSLPPEAQWMDDKEFNALFKEGKYAMGWSGGGDSSDRFLIDVDRSQGKGSK